LRRVCRRLWVSADSRDLKGETMKLRLTNKQIEVLEKVWQSPRINFADLPSLTTASLIRRGLLEKDWHCNDAAGERIRLTLPGTFVARELMGMDKP